MVFGFVDVATYSSGLLKRVNMAANTEVSRLEGWLDGASVIAALLVLPAVYLQTASQRYVAWGETLSIAIWLYFAIEIVVLMRLATDNVAWIRSHLVELIIVVVSCPLVMLLVEDQNLLAVAPVIAMTRLFRLVKFVKAVKLAKLLKADKILREDPMISGLLELVIGALVLVLTLGILGMVVHEEAHNLGEGLSFWLDGLKSLSGLRLPALVLILVIVGGLVYRLSLSVKNENSLTRQESN